MLLTLELPFYMAIERSKYEHRVHREKLGIDSVQSGAGSWSIMGTNTRFQRPHFEKWELQSL
jgi:hypothetical protein